MTGKFPGLPNIFLPMVDVRDVAEAHLRAITMNPPVGRYLCTEGKRIIVNKFSLLQLSIFGRNSHRRI